VQALDRVFPPRPLPLLQRRTQPCNPFAFCGQGTVGEIAIGLPPATIVAMFAPIQNPVTLDSMRARDGLRLLFAP